MPKKGFKGRGKYHGIRLQEIVEVSESLQRLLEPKYLYSVMSVAAQAAGQDWMMRGMPARWDPKFARQQLRHTQHGEDGIPFFEALVRSENRRWIDGAREARLTAKAKPGKISINIRHKVPNVCPQVLRRKFKRITRRDVELMGFALAGRMQTLLESRPTIRSMRRMRSAMLSSHMARYKPMMVALKAQLKTGTMYKELVSARRSMAPLKGGML